jgi:excisionase family DNA binding protein
VTFGRITAGGHRRQSRDLVLLRCGRPGGEEVCALLKIKQATLYRHTSQGTRPPFYKIGKHNRWKRREVMAWFDSLLDELSRTGR